MKVADLYIALVLLGVVATAGWVACEKMREYEDRVRALEARNPRAITEPIASPLNEVLKREAAHA